MGMLEDVMKALERIPLWKRVSALPDDIEQLKARVTALEVKLAGEPGELCPICNSPTFARRSSKPHPVFGKYNVMEDHFQCSKPECGHEERRERDPSKQAR